MPGTRGLTRPIIAGRRFVIHGLSRLTIRVARLLFEENAEVVVMAHEADRGLEPLLGETAHVVRMAADREQAFHEAGIQQAQALLVLGTDDNDNLEAAVVGSALAPAVPVILRIFNPVLAEQFATGLNVRRAYSVSALAAPFFVAAALGENVEKTLHLGDEEVALCRITVNRGSPLAGRTTDGLERDFHLALVARTAGDGAWESATGEERIDERDTIMVGGPIDEVLRLAVRDHTLFGTRRSRARRRVRIRRPRRRRVTLLPAAMVVLIVILLATATIFVVAQGFGVVEGLYFTITTAFGEQTLSEQSDWLKLVGIVTAFAGGALAAVVFGHLASIATAERLEERAGRQAERLQRHIVVAGLGTVGFRVMSQLCELDIPAVAIERMPDARFRDAIGNRAPVLTGDVRLPENLDRAHVADAEVLIACTDNDVANVLACLHARRVNPRIRTVARIVDEMLAHRARPAFGIDEVINDFGVAADAFANAATDERAALPFDTGEIRHLVLRHDFDEPVDRAVVRTWEARGLHLLAFRRGAGRAEPPSALDGTLADGDSAILAGPEGAVRALLLGG